MEEVTSGAGDSPTATTPMQPTEAPKSPRRHFLKSFDVGFRNVWFYVAAFVLIINLSYTFRPQLQIQASTLADSDPLGTLFTFVNNGAWTLYDVQIHCTLYKGLRVALQASNITNQVSPNASVTGSGIITVLRSTDPATRDCGIGQNGRVRVILPPSPEIAIDLDVQYRWLFGLLTERQRSPFDTRKVGSRFILVPDVQ